jgi:hypothetical protein
VFLRRNAAKTPQTSSFLPLPKGKGAGGMGYFARESSNIKFGVSHISKLQTSCCVPAGRLYSLKKKPLPVIYFHRQRLSAVAGGSLTSSEPHRSLKILSEE